MEKPEDLIRKALLEDTDWLYQPERRGGTYDLPQGCWMAAVPDRYIYVHGRVATQIAYRLIDQGLFEEYEPEHGQSRHQYHVFLAWPNPHPHESTGPSEACDP